MRRIAISGGAPVVIAKMEEGAGGFVGTTLGMSWGADNTILYSATSGIFSTGLDWMRSLRRDAPTRVRVPHGGDGLRHQVDGGRVLRNQAEIGFCGANNGDTAFFQAAHLVSPAGVKTG